MNETIAIIDLGTNTFHLLIAEKGGRTLHTEKRAVKIGKNGINHGVVPPDGFARALACLKDFKSKILEFNARHVRAFGTSALRNASNASALIDGILQATGIQVEVISGDREAEYIYYGARSAIDLGLEKSLIVDIGGGSVEFIIADKSTIYWKESVEIGAQRLLEKFQKHDPILPNEVQALEAEFERALGPLKIAVEALSPRMLVGSSGTFDTLSEIYCIDHGIDISKEWPATPLTVPYFHKIHKQLLSHNREQRLNIPGMIEMRVDMIVVASCLVEYLIRQFHFSTIKVSSYSLKEGVLAEWSGS
jgi:exopolyphosphatase/guanosine-5'-triphosphate,3'-diphosphate pyrophosphatase